MRLLVALIVWAAAAAGAYELQTVVAKSIGDKPATGSSGLSTTGISSSGSSSSGSTDPSSVTATDSQSLFRTANFAKALATARTHAGANARMTELALYPGYLSLQYVTGSSQTNLYIAVNGTVDETSGGDVGGQAVVPLGDVTANAPATLARRIATLAHTPTSQLHYMVATADPISGKFSWSVYPLSGNAVDYFKADGGASGKLLEYRSGSSTGLQPVGG